MPDPLTTLCCPHCGNHELYSVEEILVHFPVELTREPDGRAKHLYTGEDRIEYDDTSDYTGLVKCHSDTCADRDAFPEAELVTVAEYIATH